MAKDRSFRIYLFAVCFVSVVCAAITLGMGVYSGVKIIAPELTLNTHIYNAHQSLDNFRRSHYFATQSQPQFFLAGEAMALAAPMPIGRHRSAALDRAGIDAPEMSDEEVEQRRERSYASAISNHQRTAMQELIRLVIVLVISGALFFAHWRLIQKRVDSL